MQILFVHPNYPAQFGPMLERLATRGDVECVFVSRIEAGQFNGVRRIQMHQRGGAREQTHYCARTFENAVWQSHAVYEACKADPALKPDLILGHSGFGTTAFLRELYDCPIVNYFEYYYHPHDSDMDFRPEFPPQDIDYLRSRMRNAMILIDLDSCDAGYTPTRWQKQLFPREWDNKLDIIHDGVDLDFWQRSAGPRRIGDELIDDDTRIVTYVARGLEAMRGFDIFVRLANRIAEQMDNVIFVVVGSDRICYGNDRRHIKTNSFREHVIRAEQPDLKRFRFLGTVPPAELQQVLSLSDLHVYLTVPFVPSWSLLNALACECVVLASDTAPVREFIRDGENGFLAGFYDLDGLLRRALQVLEKPDEYRDMGRAGRALIAQHYDVEQTWPQQWELFQRVLK